MKTIVQEKYGPPEVLRQAEAETPVPADGEILIRIHAAGVNFSDWGFVRGKPFLARLWSGFLKPRKPMLGADIAGEIEDVGTGVKSFSPGDAVFGDLSSCGWGGFAEYVSVPEEAVAAKPVNLSFEEAAAVPQAAVVALQGLRDKGGIRPGQNVLICGASGGIGTFAVQIAKSFGARVTAVCGGRNIELVRSLGADRVIDYTKEDFTQSGERYDLILATAGFRPIFEYKRSLAPKGKYVATGGSMKQIFQAMLFGPFISRKNGKRLTNLAARTSREDIVFIKELLERGKIKPVIDRTYPLERTAEAIGYYGKGHTSGKVVISVLNDGN